MSRKLEEVADDVRAVQAAISSILAICVSILAVINVASYFKEKKRREEK